jgi:molybdopterin/thiamine biosynthesis adenylyltransferase
MAPGAEQRCVPRAARFPEFVGLPQDAGRRLDGLEVALVGAGSVGRAMLVHLSRLVPRTLWIIDPGKFKQTSYLTCPALAPGEEVGQSKAASAGRLAKHLSPHTRVWTFDGGVESLPAMALADADCVLLATDRLLAEVETSQRCAHLGRKLVQASVHGPTLVVQIRFLANEHYADPRPCLICGYGKQEWEALNRQTQFSCEGVYGDRAVAGGGEPTMSVSSLCALAGDLAVIQLLKSVLELGPNPDDTLLEYAGYTHRTTVSTLRRHAPNCPCDHVTYLRSRVRRSRFNDCSLDDLASAAAARLGANRHREYSFLIGDGLVFAESAICPCGVSASVGRFVQAGAELPEKCSCGQSVKPHPFYTYRQVPASAVTPLLKHPLRAVGAADAEWVVVRHADRAVLFRATSDGSDGQETP